MTNSPRYGNLFASVARTATPTPSTPQRTAGSAVLQLTITVTANPGAQTLTPILYGSVPGAVAPGTAGTTMLTFPNITANGTFNYLIGVGTGTVTAGTTFAGAVAGIPPPAVWSVGLTHSAAGSWTYQVDY